MLGETFEMVTDSYRFLAEKVQHHPKQIVAFEMEGEGYILQGCGKPQPKFGLNNGKG